MQAPFCQSEQTNFEWRTTKFQWTIRDFKHMAGSVDDALQFQKNVALIKHSCKCDLELIARPDSDAQDHKGLTSTLKVKLHSYSGQGSRLILTVSLEATLGGIQYNRSSFTSTKKSWDLTLSSEKDLEFALPSIDAKFRSVGRFARSEYCLNDFVTKDTLIIQILVQEAIEIEQVQNELQISQNECVLDTKVLADLYERKLLVDVVFIMREERKLHAHSNVLAAASPYFLAMFTRNDMRESQTLEVDLSVDKETSYDTFKAFLDYIYGIKKVRDMEEMTKNLSILADKYDCSKLHKECESILSNSLEKNNVATLLLFAHNYNCHSLKKKVLEYAKTHGMNAFKDLDEFKEICKKPELLNELISSVSAR
ncbi:hypothetical protein QAD02_005651 [Eretmocerus hayati]|uniref:Uncharacterized protein n=1 Tax=Eretmocerus hayati TaxID=131215 RepID=A0ACC2NVR4_9HYME|nr:hypothetical protein QAD02_005651 [Eretmocerus hayati]